MALGIESYRVVLTGSALGATVGGADLRDLHDAVFALLMQAWHNHSVLLFRDQTLNDQELIAFSRRLGDLDWAPIQETGRRFVEGLPEIFIVSNVKVNGAPIGGLGDGESVWHTDMSYLDVPPKASILYSLEVPVTGGNPCHSRPNTRGSLRKSLYGCQQWAGPRARVRERPRSSAPRPGHILMAPAPGRRGAKA